MVFPLLGGLSPGLYLPGHFKMGKSFLKTSPFSESDVGHTIYRVTQAVLCLGEVDLQRCYFGRQEEAEPEALFQICFVYLVLLRFLFFFLF